MFNKKSILITGGTGTFGKNVVENILKKNHFVEIANLKDYQDLPRITLGTLQ